MSSVVAVSHSYTVKKTNAAADTLLSGVFQPHRLSQGKFNIFTAAVKPRPISRGGLMPIDRTSRPSNRLGSESEFGHRPLATPDGVGLVNRVVFAPVIIVNRVHSPVKMSLVDLTVSLDAEDVARAHLDHVTAALADVNLGIFLAFFHRRLCVDGDGGFVTASGSHACLGFGL